MTGSEPPHGGGALEAVLAEGLELHKLGRLAEAEARYREVLATAPDHAEALHHLGLLRHQEGRDVEALDLLRRAATFEPSAPIYAYNLGLVLLAVGDAGAAERALRRAVALAPQSPPSLGALAALLVARGQAGEAVALYEALARLTPEDPSVAPQQAAALIRAGRVEPAIELLRQAVACGDGAPGTALLLAEARLLVADPEGALAAMEPWANDPNQPLAGFFAAELKARTGRADEAVAAAQALADAAPAPGPAMVRLARVLELTRDHAAAARAFAEAARLDEGDPAAHAGLGRLALAAGRAEAAVDALLTALRLAPADEDLRLWLGEALAAAGRLDEAAALYQDWLNELPDHPLAGHRAAACAGWPRPEQAPPAYVARLYDDLAVDYDAAMRLADYAGPALLAAMLEGYPPPQGRAGAALDLGCGTGLLAPVLRPQAGALTGVDLSPRMLDRARRTEAYDALIRADAPGFLDVRPDAYDLIAAIGLPAYFGDLAELARALVAALRPGGRVMLSVEVAADRPEGYRLRPSGRYAHGPGHVRQVLEAAGLTVLASGPAMLRREAGRPVEALMVVAARPAA